MYNKLNWSNNRLSRQLLTYIILCSSFFTLIGTGIQLYSDYRSDIESIHNGIKHIEEGYLKSMASSLWSVNYKQMKISLEGASHLPDIQYLEVREIRDNTETVVSSLGKQQQTQVIKQVFPLYYGTTNKQIGSLLVIASTAKVLQRLKEKLSLILLTQGIKTFLVSLIILIIFHRLIMRHLVKMTRYFVSFDLDNLSTPLTIKRRLPRQQDLFSQLIDSINLMRLRLKENLEQRIVNEDELRRLRNQLKNIVDSMPAILIGVDRNMKITHWNRKTELEIGTKAGDAMGKNLLDVFPPLADQMGMINRVMQKSQPDRNEKITRRIGNKKVFWDMMVYPLDTNGTEGTVIRIEDVTEKVQLNQMMIQSEKMISVGGIAAGIAHEINNPLAAIISGVQNISRRIDPAMDKNLKVASALDLDLNIVQDYLAKRDILNFLQGVEESGKRAAKIVSNMLHFARRSEPNMEMVDLILLIENTIELLNKDYNLKKKYDFKHIKITRQFEPEQIPLMCSEIEIEQVLLNLLKNAAEAIFENEHLEEPQIDLSVYSDGKKVQIEVKDNGPGMAKEEQLRVFEPFFTTKAQGMGTGLGLSVSYMIITKNHRGTMAVESEKDKGTKFIIHLPVKNG